MRTVRIAVAACAAATALAACGSTVEQGYGARSAADGGLGGGASSAGLGDSGTVAGGPSSGAPGSDGGTVAGGQDGTSGTSGGGTGTTGTSGGGQTGTSGKGGTTGTAKGGAASAAKNGLGVTATTITIGVLYTENGEAANSAIGGSAITQGDDKANYQALFDDANEKGGIAGHKLVPLFHAYDAQSSQTGAQQDNAACSDFTKDHQVIAVFGGSLTPTLSVCLAKVGVPLIKTGLLIDDDKTLLQQYPTQFLLGAPSQDRVFGDLVNSFDRQGYFGGWNTVTGAASAATPVKVGIITYDPPQFTRAVNNVLVPALTKAGHAPAKQDVIVVTKPAAQSDLSTLVPQIQNATLKLQQDGVTHVVLNDANGLILGFFGTNARNQGYYPRLGVTSGAGPQAIKDAGLVQASQLAGMSGLGWLPSLDLPAADGNAYQTASTAKCLQLIKDKTGQTFTSTNAASIALTACDATWSFVQGMQHSTDLSPAGVVTGLESLKGSYVPALIPSGYLGAGRHDSAQRGFDLNYDAGCTCVKYSAPHDIP